MTESQKARLSIIRRWLDGDWPTDDASFMFFHRPVKGLAHDFHRHDCQCEPAVVRRTEFNTPRQVLDFVEARERIN